MTVKDAMEILGAKVLVGKERLDEEVRSACGSDMMSDVLAFCPQKLLAALASLPLTDVTIAEPDLEEIFMHYYTPDGRRQTPEADKEES